MGPYTVDASVFLNAFNPREVDHDASQRFLAVLHQRALPMIDPVLLLPEAAATVARGSGDATLARDFAGTLRRLPHLLLVPLDDVLAEAAVDIAARYRLRGSDAVYAAVSLRFGTTLVTLDREQRARVAPAVIARTPQQALDTLTGAAGGGRDS